jgi:hypothetical protein
MSGVRVPHCPPSIPNDLYDRSASILDRLWWNLWGVAFRTHYIEHADRPTRRVCPDVRVALNHLWTHPSEQCLEGLIGCPASSPAEAALCRRSCHRHSIPAAFLTDRYAVAKLRTDWSGNVLSGMDAGQDGRIQAPAGAGLARREKPVNLVST